MGKERKVWHDPLKSVRCESSWSVSVATVAGSGRLALIPPLRGWRRRASVRVSGMDGDRLAANWGSRCSAAYRRVAACVERGLLERLALLRDEPSLIRASREGLRYAGLGGLPVGVISPGAVEHWLRCASTALTLEAEFAGRVISERELVFAELGRGQGAALKPHGEDQLALADDAPGELRFEREGGRGAAQPVLNRARRDDPNRQAAQPGVAQALAAGADQAGLVAQQSQALQQAALDTGGDAAVGGAAPRSPIRCQAIAIHATYTDGGLPAPPLRRSKGGCSLPTERCGLALAASAWIAKRGHCSGGTAEPLTGRDFESPPPRPGRRVVPSQPLAAEAEPSFPFGEDVEALQRPQLRGQEEPHPGAIRAGRRRQGNCGLPR